MLKAAQDGVVPGIEHFGEQIQGALRHNQPFSDLQRVLRVVEDAGKQAPPEAINLRALMRRTLDSVMLGSDPRVDCLSPERQCYAGVEIFYLSLVKAREYLVMAARPIADHQGDVAMRRAIPALCEDLFRVEHAAYQALWPDRQFGAAYELIVTQKKPEYSQVESRNCSPLPEDEALDSLRGAARALWATLTAFTREHLAEVDPAAEWIEPAVIAGFLTPG